MAKIIRKFISATLLFALMLVFSASVLPVFADDDVTYLKGTEYVTFDCPDGTEIEIAGKKYTPISVEDEPITLKYVVDGIDTKGSKLFLGDTELGIVELSGTIEIPAESLSDGENEILIRLVTNKGGVYNDSLVYGSFNLDDITVKSFTLTDASGRSIEMKLVKYMPISKSAGNTEETVPYDGAQFDIGDGWLAATGLGGSTPNTPVMVGFAFSRNDVGAGQVYEIDTTALADGENTVKFYDTASGTYLNRTETLYVNNIAPAVVYPFANNTAVAKDKPLTVTIADSVSGVKTVQFFIDGEKARTAYMAGEFELDISGLSVGRHTVHAIATDRTGNTAYHFGFFTATEASTARPVITEGAISVESGKPYGTSLVKNINMYTNPVGDFVSTHLRSDAEELVSFSDIGRISTTAAGNYIPYQSFVVDVSDKTGDAVVSCSAETGDFAKYVAAVWNYSASTWDVLAEAPSGAPVTFKADLSEYSRDGSMRVNVYPKVVGNGSDTMLWYTDTQYYSRYDDLNFLYESIVRYAADEYRDGEIAYTLFTGDFIDQMVTDDIATKEYAVADKMQKILDDSGVPNGVAVGNHDVKHETLDYSYYLKYFPTTRFSSQECYGGTFDQNISHFDLVTVGGYDFLMLCIGYGMIDDPATIEWANAVLEEYSGYNAIIATHAYINPSGQWLSNASRVMWESIVVPNENVKMILCGHYEGACDSFRQVGDSDRKVLEILHDYQFSELGQGPKHTENGMKCDGEGFLRLMSFTEAGQMVMTTYSPNYDMDHFFAPYVDNYIHTLDLTRENRSITTSFFTVGTDITETASAEGYDAVFADDSGKLSELTLNGAYTPNEYELSGMKPDYTVPSEIYGTPWFSQVSPTLVHSAASEPPSSDIAVNAGSLLPDNADKLVRTSGNTVFENKVNDNGSLSVLFTGSDSTWITLRNTVTPIPITEMNCVYFSVTAGDSVKWNISINTTGNKSYSFSQLLYKHFGYDSYAIPSDIVGSWHGYIDLSEWLSPNENVLSIYLVSATKDETVTFDYLFMGKPAGVAATFVVDENTSKIYRTASGGTIAEPEAPFSAGKSFKGWLDGNGNIAEFPAVITADTVYTASFETTDSQTVGRVYYDTEVAFAEVISPTEPSSTEPTSESEVPDDGDSKLWMIIAGAVALLIAVAVAVILLKRKKR